MAEAPFEQSHERCDVRLPLDVQGQVVLQMHLMRGVTNQFWMAW